MRTELKLNDLVFTPFLSEEEIRDRVRELGQELTAHYAGRQPVLLGVLNGAFMFAADLVRAMDITCELSFIKLSSYEGTMSSGQVATRIGLEAVVQDRPVLLIEDIVDSGRTMHQYLPRLQKLGPSEIRIATFLLKPDALVFDVKPDFVGFSIPSTFVVGYGLDYNGLGRNLPGIYQLSS